MDEQLTPDTQQLLNDPEFQKFHAQRTAAPAPSNPGLPASSQDLTPEAQAMMNDPEFQKFHAQRVGVPKPKAPQDTGGFVAGVKSNAGSIAKGVGQFGADYIPGVGQDNSLKKWGQGVMDANPTTGGGFAGLLEHPVDSLLEYGGGIVSSLGTVAGIGALGQGIAKLPLPGLYGLATKAVGHGLTAAAPYIAFGAPAQASIREQQIQDDPTAVDSMGKKLLATVGAGTIGAIAHKLGPEGKFGEKLLSQAGRTELGRMMTANTIKGAVGQGVMFGAAQGLLEEPVEQVASLHNPLRPENLLRTVDNALVEAVGGGAFGGGLKVGHNLLKPKPGTVNDTNTQKDVLNPNAKRLSFQANPPMVGYMDGSVGVDTNPQGWDMHNAFRLDILRAKAEGKPARTSSDANGNPYDIPATPKQKLTPREAEEYAYLKEKEQLATPLPDAQAADQFTVLNQSVPLPTDVGGAIAALRALQAPVLPDGRPSMIPAGSDHHLAILRSEQILRAAGIDPASVVPPVEIAPAPPVKASARAPKTPQAPVKVAPTKPVSPHADVIAGADVPEPMRKGMFKADGGLRKHIGDFLDTQTAAKDADLQGWHQTAVQSNADKPGSIRGAEWKIPLVESMLAQRGLKPLTTDAQATKVPDTPKAVAQGDQARGLMEHLLSKLQGKQQAGVGRDYAGMLRTFLGTEGTGDDKLQSVAEAHGLKTRQSAHQAIFGYTNRGKWVKGAIERIRDIAEEGGHTSEEAKAALHDLQKAREDQYGLSEDQKEIQNLAGGMETGLGSENQGRMDFSDASAHGLISQEMKHHNMGDAAAVTGAKYSEDGAESTAKGVPLSSDRMATASVEALVGDQALDLGVEAKNQAGEEQRNISRTKAVATFKSVAERKAAVGKTIAEIDAEQAAERAGKEQAKADAQALKAAQQKENTQAAKEKRQPKTLTMGDLNQETARGDTNAPKYNHTPEERAKGEMLWAEDNEDKAGIGEPTVAFDELPQDVQDAYIQAVKDVLSAPTVRPNLSRLQKLHDFYTDENYDKTARYTDSEAESTPSGSARPGDERASGEEGKQPVAQEVPYPTTAKTPASDRAPVQEPRLAPDKVAQGWDLAAEEEGLPKFKDLSAEDRAHLLGAKDQAEFDDAVDAIADRLAKPLENKPDTLAAKEPQITRALEILGDLTGKKRDASNVDELYTILSDLQVAEAVRERSAMYENLSELNDAIDAGVKAAKPAKAAKPVDANETPSGETQTPLPAIGEPQAPVEKTVQRRRVVKMEKAKAPEPEAPKAEEPAPAPVEEASAPKAVEAEEATRHATAPFDPFKGETVATSKGVSPGIAGVAKGWAKMLGLKGRLYITTLADSQANRGDFTGPYRTIGSSGINPKEQGRFHRLENGDYYIILRDSTSRTRTLEVLAHELGHMHMAESWGNADPATKTAIETEFMNWRNTAGKGTARELINTLRAKTTAKTTDIRNGEAPASTMRNQGYWQSFNEWYADQVSKWATTSEKPLTVVEKFFSKLAQAMRSFYAKLVNGKYLPNTTFKAYMDRVTENPVNLGEGKDTTGTEPQLSLNSAESTILPRIESIPHKGLREATGRTYLGFKDAVRNGLLGSAFIHDVIDFAVNHGIPTARKYQELMEAKNKMSRVLSAPLQEIASLANELHASELSKEGPLSVNKFMSDMSYAQKWAWQPDSPIWNGRQVKIDRDLAARFAKLSPKAQEVAKAAVDYGETMRQELAKVGVEIAAGDGPYLPHKRFGDHLVVSKSAEYLRREALEDKSHMELQDNPEHYNVQAFDSHWDALQAFKGMQANKAFAKGDVRQTKAEQYFSQVQLAPMDQIARLENIINGSDLSAKTKTTIASALGTLYKQTLHNMSARHAEQRRMNVAGADVDMLRALFTQGHASSALVSILAHGKEIEGALTQMRDEAHTVDRDGKSKDALNEVLRRHALSMVYKPTPWQDKIMQFTAFQKVITSPAFFLQQATEPFMMLAPVLAGHFKNYPGTMREMGSAFAQAFKTVGVNPMHSGSAPDAILAKLKGHKNSVGRDYDAIKELIDTGRADVGNLNDFGSVSTKGDSPVSYAFNQVMSKVARVATDMEEINRIASGLTSYRMKYRQLKAEGKADDVAHDAATAFAVQMVDHSHGNYAAWAKPRYMMQQNSSVPIKVITQFRAFQVMQLSLMGRLFRDAFSSADADTKAAAKSALMYMYGQMGLVAGGLGLPFAGVVSDIASLFLADDEEPWGRDTTELHLRRFIGDKGIADLLLRGAPATAGVDVSKRIGGSTMGDLAPYSDLSVTGRKDLMESGFKLLGPFIGGTLPAASDAIKMSRQGEYQKAMEGLLPTALVNVSKAYRFANEGVTSTRGDVLMKPSQLTSFDIASQALGLPSTTLTGRQFKQSAMMDRVSLWKEREERYTHEYVKATKEKDKAAQQAAVKSFQAIQEEKRKMGGIGTPLSSIYKAPMEQMKRQSQNVAGIEVNKQTRGIITRMEQQGV